MKFNIFYFLGALVMSFAIYQADASAAAPDGYFDDPAAVMAHESGYEHYLIVYSEWNTTYYMYLFNEGEYTKNVGDVYVSSSAPYYLLNDWVTNNYWTRGGTGYSKTFYNDDIKESTIGIGYQPGGDSSQEGGNVEIPNLEDVSQIPAEMVKVAKTVLAVCLVGLSILLGAFLIKRVIYSFL